jgi:hypothetical protein
MTDKELLELAAKAAGMVAYNPETGSMLWLHKPEGEKDAVRWNSRYAGKECGTIDDKGYRRILFRFCPDKTFKIRAHRLAWFIAYQKMPEGEIDHINQNKADNRLSNLRDVSREINQRNGTRKRNNTSGVPGVSWHKQSRKWCAQVNLLGVHHHIGSFSEIEKAGLAVQAFRAKHEFTQNHGRIA